MNTTLNNEQPPSDWVEQIMRAYLMSRETTAQQPSEAFRARCRASALGALDILKMQPHRTVAAGVAGSLLDHLLLLATLADVKLNSVFETLDISSEDPERPSNYRGLVTLARHLGLAYEEVVMRIRWGMAHLTSSQLRDIWPGSVSPAQARHRGMKSPTPLMHSLTQELLRCEKGYPPDRRADLRDALHIVAQVYGE